MESPKAIFQRLMPAILLLTGCTPTTPHPAVVTDGEGFFGQPWPSDTRTQNGRPDMSGFPQREDNPLIDAYLSQIESLDGFGTNSPIYVPLDGPIDAIPLAGETLRIDGPVMLIDIDPHSPERGRLTPVDISQFEATTRWQRADMLAIQPVFGFPLRPATTYALVLGADWVQHSTTWRDSQDWTNLDNTLLASRADTREIAYALQFTTQDPVGEMARFSARIQADLSMTPLDQALTRFWVSPNFSAHHGALWVPMWQHGQKPYLSSGGGFVFDKDGMPELSGWERAQFTLTVPSETSMPENGWPVVIYGHGTGGDNDSFATGGNRLSPAAELASAGIAGFGISLPLHGDRGTAIDPALASFNYLNPESARACFRQAALDQIFLAELLSTMPHHFDIQNGQARTDPSRIAYMGHSHGGLIGAIAAPFFGDNIKATFLSGAGGGISTTVVSRDAGDFDVQGILTAALDFEDDDVLSVGHPALAMIQVLAEVTDPINYAPFWAARQPHWQTSPSHVLMTSGRQDQQTPPATADALAAAGQLPIIMPAAHISPAHQLQENAFDTAPTFANRDSWDGGRVSAGLVQFQDDDHFAIFTNDTAAKLYIQFLSSALDNEAPRILQP